jgi:signal transduction histidine kinase
MVSLWQSLVVCIIDLLSLIFGFLVYFKNRKRSDNQYFFLLCLSTATFISSAYLSEFFPATKPFLALFLARVTYTAVIWWSIFLFLFSLTFPEGKQVNKTVTRLLFFVGFLFSLLIIFTPFFVKGIKLQPWGFDTVYGRLFTPLFGSFFIVFLISFILNAFKKYKKATPSQKLQLRYFFLGLIIFCGLLTFFNAVLPFIIKTEQYYFLGNYSAIIFLGFTAYSIIAHRLFGIEVILTEILVGLIGLLLIVQIFTAQTILWRFINGLIFLLFCVFGYLLIRGVLREIKLRETVEKISQAKSEFISIASHQLRTPLSAIKGYLSMILEGSYGNLPEKVKKPMENVYQSNERLIKLVNDILSVSKIEAGEMEMNWEKEDLREIIKEVISELSIKAKEKNLYLKFEEPKEFPKVLLDREKIRQVILNLVDNAIRYTQKGGVTVKLQIANGRLQIVVSDTGEGLTKEEKEKLFERFSRGTAGTKFWTEGAGLGLYIARRFVEMHKGKIWAESEGRGKGSTFYIELPIR